MLTAFGHTFRQIRKDRGLMLKDVAEKLGKMPSFISAIEHGDKSIPNGYVAKVCDVFELNDQERRLLCNAEYQVRNEVTIQNLKDLSIAKQQLATSLAQELPRLSDDRVRQIIAFLRSEDDETCNSVFSSAFTDD